MDLLTSKNNNNIPSIFVLFGMTGDLVAKKIIPSLWHLFQQQRLPNHLAIIGFSRRDLMDTELKTLIKESIEKHGGVITNEEEFLMFSKLFSYQAGTFEDKESFSSLSSHIDKIEAEWNMCANKLFYLAVPPTSYEKIFKNLAEAKLNLPCGEELGWSRILIEKPFGAGLVSAQELQTLLSSYFKEEQIYRIDHYLFKEIIQGIENFRFSNNLFEDIWDNTRIDRIDIRLHESIGVENRGSFYDSVGTLRDVGQNHLLTMLAAITMEYPHGMSPDTVRKNRARILETLSPWTDDSVSLNTFRSQYNGYKNINGVSPDSETETYFAFKTELLHPRWKDVPIFIEAGKRMAEARKEIVVTLKHPNECLLCQIGPHAPNSIVFRLEPNDEIVIHFWMKKPGFEHILEERVFSFFLYEKETKVQYVEEYSKVIYAAIAGNQTHFVSSEEVESEWKFTDPIINAWKNDLTPLSQYEPDTTPSPVVLRVELDRDHVETTSRAGAIGIIGLGKMGGNIARRLISKKWSVVGFNKTPDETKELVSEGIDGAYSLREFVEKLSKPRIVWLMVPHQTVDEVLVELISLLEKGDTIIDGGNSPYRESIRRGKELESKGIDFLDIGVSGGPGGARTGACMMAGGKIESYKKLEATGFFNDACVQNGWGYMGTSGAGHFVKMVHNGIEYGMMQSIAEGLDLMHSSKEFKLDMKKVMDVYSHGSVITSSLVSWMNDAYKKYGEDLNDISGKASASGEGAWTVEAGRREGVKMPAIQTALDVRKASQVKTSYQGKVISAMRGEFGQHPVSRGEDEPEIITN